MVDSQDEPGKTLGLDLHSVELSFKLINDLHQAVEEVVTNRDASAHFNVITNSLFGFIFICALQANL